MRLSLLFLLMTLIGIACKSTAVSESEDHGISTEKIQTTNMPNNEELFSYFESELAAQKFLIEDSETNTDYSVYDGTRNVDVHITGEGVRWYYIKRTEKTQGNYRPDFTLYVFEFKNEAKAKNCLKKINAALHSDAMEYNGKGPQTITMYENEVFFFSSRAEAFRGYINDFAEKIENYSI